MPKEVFFKVYGLQRSGTTYMRELLRRNFSATVLTNELGWKHGEVQEPQAALLKDRRRGEGVMALLRERIAKRDVVGITIVKNPHSWLPSIKRYAARAWPQAAAWTKKQFVELWNERNGYYAGLPPEGLYCYRRFAIMRYEDVLADLPAALARIAAVAGCEMPPVAVDVKKVEQSSPFCEEQRRFYLNPPEEAAVLAYGNKALMKKLGYLM